MTEQVLTTSDVTIKQATVEIKVLKIGNKQVTQAVFKQLPEKSIIDYDGQLQGEAWGRVNYHIDCDGLFLKEHMHVVWQEGQQLYRSLACQPLDSPHVPENIIHDQKIELEVAAYFFLIARTLEGWRPERSRELYQLVRVHSRHAHVDMEGQSDRLWQAWNNGGWNWKKNLSEYISNSTYPIESARYHNEYFLPHVAELENAEKQWQQSYDQLQQLDQLFIAV